MAPPLDAAAERLTREDAGYHKALKNRQIQMIALGGAIGTGLFLGAGGRLASAGPGLFIVYGICGIFVFLILRALGELVLHRASSGSFVSYAREFFGEKVAFAAGWMYFLNWAMTGIVDTTAIATYCHYWQAFQVIPQWTLALIALVVVVSMNLISVKLFGELEFWASLIKVLALVTFLVVGTVFLAGRLQGRRPATPGRGCGAATAGCCRPACCRWCSSPRAWYSPTPPSNWSASRPGKRRTRRRSCRARSTRWCSASRSSTSGRRSCSACCCPTPPITAGVSPFVTFFSKAGFDGGGQPDEPRGAHRRAVQPERRAVFHGPDPAVDGDERQRPEIHHADVEERRAVRRHPADRRDRPVRHRAQRLSYRTRPSRSCCTSPRWVSWWPGRRSWRAS